MNILDFVLRASLAKHVLLWVTLLVGTVCAILFLIFTLSLGGEVGVQIPKASFFIRPTGKELAA